MRFDEQLFAVHEALVAANIPHAFGGAIALAYCIKEPRGTRDIDINVFVDAQRSDEVLDSLPEGVIVRDIDRTKARRDEQVRVMWNDTPIDFFFDAHDFHHQVAEGIREVPFGDMMIPVLGCEALMVFKAMFNRGRDWADIDSMLRFGIDPTAPLERLQSLLGNADASVIRLRALASDYVI